MLLIHTVYSLLLVLFMFHFDDNPPRNVPKQYTPNEIPKPSTKLLFTFVADIKGMIQRRNFTKVQKASISREYIEQCT